MDNSTIPQNKTPHVPGKDVSVILKTIRGYRYTLDFNAPAPLHGGSFSCREGMLVALEAEEEFLAWGEAAPLPGFSLETLDLVEKEAYQISCSFLGMSRHGRQHHELSTKGISPAVHFAFQTALDNLSAWEARTPLHEFLNPNAPDQVGLCALVDGATEVKRKRARRAIQLGHRTLKIKVGAFDIEQDASLVREILDDCGSEIHLRLDANRAWNREQALRFCRNIPVDQIAFLEEPTQDFHDLLYIQKNTGIACAVDETLQALSQRMFDPRYRTMRKGTEDLRNVVEQACFLVWKPSLCFPIPMLGIQSKVPIVLSAAYESGVGTAAILAHAASISANPMAAGVDTYTRLATDVLHTPLPLNAAEADLAHIEIVRTCVNPARLKELWRAQ